MVGFGAINGPQGTMEALVKSQAGKYAHLVGDHGQAIPRDDVWIVDLSTETKQGYLSTGFGAKSHYIGPEYAFGIELGNYLSEPVLIIKCAWGGKSLYHDFLPPGARKSEPAPKDGDHGFYYSEILRHVREITQNLKKYCPVYKGTDFEIIGFGWHQGWNDRLEQDAVDIYESNLVHLIEAIRKDLAIPELPFVIANTGMSGWQVPERYRAKVEQHLDAQLAVGDFRKYPQFEGNVATVETRVFRRAPDVSPAPSQEYHWYQNWESYYLIGESMGRVMIQLLPANQDNALLPPAQASSLKSDQKASIDAVFLAQTHVNQPDDLYFKLTANREALLKVHVVSPQAMLAPKVAATLINENQSINIELSGSERLPLSIASEPGKVQHQFSDSFTVTLPKEWIQPGLKLRITAGEATYTSMIRVGPSNPISMHMFDIDYFGLGKRNGYNDYPDGFFQELEAKWPVSDLIVKRIGPIVFNEMVIPARAGLANTKVRSKDEYKEKTGSRFDGEQAAALQWVRALSAANGFYDTALSYVNIVGVPSGGQAGNFQGVTQIGNCGIAHHELGHSLGLPHWGADNYPYKGAMHGIPAPPTFNEVHVGPTWGYDSNKKIFIAPTVQNKTKKGDKLFEIGMFRHDPMQGGGTGTQDSPFLMNHFSDYSVHRMQSYMEEKLAIRIGDDYYKWDPRKESYSQKVSTRDNQGIDFPLKANVPVYSVMAACALSDKTCNLVYQPIGPYAGNLMLLFDPRIKSQRDMAIKKGIVPEGGCDFSLRIEQGKRVIYCMLPASANERDDPLKSHSLKTRAINLESKYGAVQSVHLLLTPDAQLNGLPNQPEILDTWVNAN